MTIGAVIFDYYFTLVDGEVHALSSIDSLLQRHGVDADAASVLDAWRRLGVPDVERTLDGDPPPFESLYDRWRAHGGRLLTQLGITAPADEWADCRRDAHRRATVYPDVDDGLAALQEMGMPLGVLSDADADTLLPSIDLNALRFDVVMCSEEHRCYKPHRSLFLAACEALEVDPANAVYVGDNPRADVGGAQNAGMRAVWINRQNRSWPDELAPPDDTITTIDELPALIDN